MAVSTLLIGEYGLNDVYLKTRCVAGKIAVEHVIALELAADEQSGLHASAATLRETYESVR